MSFVIGWSLFLILLILAAIWRGGREKGEFASVIRRERAMRIVATWAHWWPEDKK